MSYSAYDYVVCPECSAKTTELTCDACSFIGCQMCQLRTVAEEGRYCSACAQCVRVEVRIGRPLMDREERALLELRRAHDQIAQRAESRARGQSLRPVASILGGVRKAFLATSFRSRVA